MARVPGELLWPLMRGEAFEGYLNDFTELLARLHGLAWSDAEAGLALAPRRTIQGQLDYLMGIARRFGLPGFEQAATWLRARAEAIAPIPLAPVHWDFHPANVLVQDKQYWVIDWTQWELTDPRFDLAWTLLLAGSQASWQDAERILEGYRMLRSSAVGDLDFFEATACAKRLLSVFVSLDAGADTLGMRPGAEQIMAGQLDRIAQVYRRWLALTQTPLAAAEQRLAGHL
jgi:aminoglycoside phosphotransferase (APT) family kinase protein